MLHRFLLALALLLLPASAMAQDMAGNWDFRVDGTTIFRFSIEEGADGEWLGSWQRPAQFNTDGNAFSNIGGGVRSTDSMTGIEFLGMIELSFDDPRPGAIPDIFRFERTGPATARMTYVGTDLAPYPLVLAGEGDSIGNWEQGRVYRRVIPAAVPATVDGHVREIGGLESFDLSHDDGVTVAPRAVIVSALPEAVEDEEAVAVGELAPAEEEVGEEEEAAEADEWGAPERITVGSDFLDDF